jgi:hypothetical protein
MFVPTRRRTLGLLIAAGLGTRVFPIVSHAFAQDEAEDNADAPDTPAEPGCYDSKKFGPWTGQASDKRAGASQDDVPVLNANACALTIELQVNTDFEAKIFITGDAEKMPLPKDFLVKPENRLLAKTTGGAVAVDEPLCGNCTDIYDDAVGIVLPLAIGPLFRELDTVELALRLAGKNEDCRFKVDCVTLRKALDWAAERRDALAEQEQHDACASPEGCFITTACCEVLGLDDDCFELRALRRYRDDVLAHQSDGAAAIARYYVLAPQILGQLPAAGQHREKALLSAYARYVLPAAIAARLDLNALAYRLYVRMLNELAGTDTTASVKP